MTLYGIARCFFRQGRILNILTAVAFLFLLYDPEQLFDPSFQLSFLSAAAIAVMVKIPRSAVLLVFVEKGTKAAAKMKKPAAPPL